jgi:hypothetical protein
MAVKKRSGGSSEKWRVRSRRERLFDRLDQDKIHSVDAAEASR